MNSTFMYIAIYAVILLVPLIAGLILAIWGIRKHKKAGK